MVQQSMEERFGDGLRRWRVGSGLTRAELARYGPMTEEHLRRLEEGLTMAEASSLLHPLGYTLGRAEAILSPGGGPAGAVGEALPEPARRALQAGYELGRKRG